MAKVTIYRCGKCDGVGTNETFHVGMGVPHSGKCAHCGAGGDQFIAVDDPTRRDEIEAFLKAKVEAYDAETGLYDVGLSYVVVDRVSEGEKEVVTFEWFNYMMEFSDVLNENE